MATDIGLRAETAAAQYLLNMGYKVLHRNWRTRYCEIDIVAERGGIIHMVEVKYRSNLGYGSGFEYITPTKLKQLVRAANIFMADQGRDGSYQIDVAAVSGDFEDPQITLIENVTL